MSKKRTHYKMLNSQYVRTKCGKENVEYFTNEFEYVTCVNCLKKFIKQEDRAIKNYLNIIERSRKLIEKIWAKISLS